MAKESTTTITPDENLESEVAGLTPDPSQTPVVAPTQEIKVKFKQRQTPVVAPTQEIKVKFKQRQTPVVAPTQEIKVEFKQPAYETTRLTTIFSNLSMQEITEIHAALVANQDKQPETKIFLFLRKLEEIGIKNGRITVKE
jgi:hypothetical protein